MNNQNNLSAQFLIKDPERAFELPTLTYSSLEIDEIIDSFDKSANVRPVYKWVKYILSATRTFRQYTMSEDLFAEMRNLSKTEYELMQILNHMAEALETVELLQGDPEFDKKDQQIFQAAIDYCKASIKERIHSLNPTDKLLPLWEKSTLKTDVT